MTERLNLFLIGASKAGTTTLWSYLNQLDSVRMLSEKEPYIFSFSNWSERLAPFANELQGAGRWKGEASTMYAETTISPEIPERLHQYNPDARIIYVVREPIDRILSAWRQTHAVGHQYRSVYRDKTDSRDVPPMHTDFKKAIWEYPLLLEACKYHTHLQRYLEFFPREQILLLFYEDLKTDPEAFYQHVHAFLSLGPPDPDTTDLWTNRRSGKKVEIHPGWKRWNQALGLKSRLDRHPAFKEWLRGLINAPKKLHPAIPMRLKAELYAELESEMTGILRAGGKSRSYWPCENTKNR